MGTSNVEVFVAAFGSEDEAGAALKVQKAILLANRSCAVVEEGPCPVRRPWVQVATLTLAPAGVVSVFSAAGREPEGGTRPARWTVSLPARVAT
jgi:hypothetical protein